MVRPDKELVTVGEQLGQENGRFFLSWGACSATLGKLSPSAAATRCPVHAYRMVMSSTQIGYGPIT
eukprot:641357-Rhodomonas_salina.3